MKYGLEVTKDHSNWYHSKAWARFSIQWLYLASYPRQIEMSVENRDFYISFALDAPC